MPTTHGHDSPDDDFDGLVSSLESGAVVGSTADEAVALEDATSATGTEVGDSATVADATSSVPDAAEA